MKSNSFSASALKVLNNIKDFNTVKNLFVNMGLYREPYKEVCRRHFTMGELATINKAIIIEGNFEYDLEITLTNGRKCLFTIDSDVNPKLGTKIDPKDVILEFLRNSENTIIKVRF